MPDPASFPMPQVISPEKQADAMATQLQVEIAKTNHNIKGFVKHVELALNSGPDQEKVFALMGENRSYVEKSLDLLKQIAALE